MNAGGTGSIRAPCSSAYSPRSEQCFWGRCLCGAPPAPHSDAEGLRDPKAPHGPARRGAPGAEQPRSSGIRGALRSARPLLPPPGPAGCDGAGRGGGAAWGCGADPCLWSAARGPTALHSYAPTCVSLHPSVSATLHRFFIPASFRFLHGYIPPFLHPFIAPPLHLCVPTSIPTSLHLSTPTSLIHPSLYIPASFQSYSPTTPHPISPTSLHSHIPASLFPYISLHPSNPTAPHPLYSSTPPLPHTTILTPPAPCIPSQGSQAVNRNDTAGFWCQSRIWRVLVLKKAESRAPSSWAAISPLQNPLQVHPGVSWAQGANAAPQPGETEAWSNAKSRAQRHSGLEQAQENKHCASYSHCCLCTLQPSTLRAH